MKGEYLHGAIDDMYLFEGALSGDGIRALMNEGKLTEVASASGE